MHCYIVCYISVESAEAFKCSSTSFWPTGPLHPPWRATSSTSASSRSCRACPWGGLNGPWLCERVSNYIDKYSEARILDKSANIDCLKWSFGVILYPKDPHISTSELCHISPNPTLRRFQGSRIAIPQRSQSSPGLTSHTVRTQFPRVNPTLLPPLVTHGISFHFEKHYISHPTPKEVLVSSIWNAEAVGKLEKDWILRYQKGWLHHSFSNLPRASAKSRF